MNTEFDDKEKLPEFLQNMSKNSGFIVPDGYFSQLSEQIQSKISSDNKAQWISKKYFLQLKYVAVYFVLIGIGIFALLNNKQEKATFLDNTNEQLALLAEQIYISDDYDENFIFTLYESVNSDFSQTEVIENKANGLLDETQTELSDDEIISYLMEEEFSELIYTFE